jgi:hypothetical protein
MTIRRLILLALLAAAPLALADGGRLRFRQAAGPFVVTLFTTPDPLSAGPADFSVAVERAGTEGIVQDADVTLLLTPLDGGDRVVLHASHAAATSRFLEAANFTLPRAGQWRVTVVVQQGSDVGKCSGAFDVAPAGLVTNQIGWNVVLVLAAVVLFLLHQARKRAYWRKLRSAMHAGCA